MNMYKDMCVVLENVYESGGADVGVAAMRWNEREGGGMQAVILFTYEGMRYRKPSESI